MEGSPEESDTSSSLSSPVEDNKENKKEEADKPPVEFLFDLQVLYFLDYYIRPGHSYVVD